LSFQLLFNLSTPCCNLLECYSCLVRSSEAFALRSVAAVVVSVVCPSATEVGCVQRLAFNFSLLFIVLTVALGEILLAWPQDRSFSRFAEA